MTPDGLDYIDDCLDLPVLLVYHRKVVSEKMWKLFYHKLKIITGSSENEIEKTDGGYGFEFFTVMMSFIQNCISFGGDAFFNLQHEGETPFELLMKSMVRILEIERNQENIYVSSV